MHLKAKSYKSMITNIWFSIYLFNNKFLLNALLKLHKDHANRRGGNSFLSRFETSVTTELRCDATSH